MPKVAFSLLLIRRMLSMEPLESLTAISNPTFLATPAMSLPNLI